MMDRVYIALFRGINVGGKNRLPMKELVSALEGLGCSDVKTYIQSGNAVFRSREPDPARLASLIKGAVEQDFGFAPYVLLLSVDDIHHAIENNPFPDAETDPSHLHLGFLGAGPTVPDLDKIEGLRAPRERFRLLDGVFYLHAPDGVGNSKLAVGVERLLRVPVTDRNWTTTLKLRDMAQELTES